MKQFKSTIICDGKLYAVRTIVEAPHPIDQIFIEQLASRMRGKVTEI
jgi:hypothetical protein